MSNIPFIFVLLINHTLKDKQMKNLFNSIFGQSFESVVSMVKSMETHEQFLFLFWSGCVVLFYSTVLYIIYLVGKDLVTKLFTTLKIVK